MNYVDGFVAAVPAANRDRYVAHAREAAAIMKEYGALRIVECWGDDVPAGEVTSFGLAVKKRDDETVCFSWIEWPSKAVRDEAVPRMMADPRMKEVGAAMPFDGKRLIYGGFQMVLEA